MRLNKPFIKKCNLEYFDSVSSEIWWSISMVMKLYFQMYHRLNVLGISQAYSTTLNMIDDLCEGHDKEVIQWAKEMEMQEGLQVSFV